MEEIGFIYVLALSVILLSSVILTVQNSTSDRKLNATTTFYQDVAHHLASAVQDVITSHLVHPDISYTRYITLRHTDLAYGYRIEFSQYNVTVISRVGDIKITANFYNPTEIEIAADYIADAKFVCLYYDPLENSISIISVSSIVR